MNNATITTSISTPSTLHSTTYYTTTTLGPASTSFTTGSTFPINDGPGLMLPIFIAFLIVIVAITGIVIAFQRRRAKSNLNRTNRYGKRVVTEVPDMEEDVLSFPMAKRRQQPRDPLPVGASTLHLGESPPPQFLDSDPPTRPLSDDPPYNQDTMSYHYD